MWLPQTNRGGHGGTAPTGILQFIKTRYIYTGDLVAEVRAEREKQILVSKRGHGAWGIVSEETFKICAHLSADRLLKSTIDGN